MEQVIITIETIVVAMTVIWFFYLQRRSLQILQQEQYSLHGYGLYLRKFFLQDKRNFLLFLHIIYIPFLKYWFIQVLFLITLSITIRYKQAPPIKKLRYTPRILRLFFVTLTQVVVSYTLLLLYIDFHNLIQAALIAIILSPIHILLSYFLLYPLEALIHWKFMFQAKRKLAKINPFIIAITGSYGKTSTKFILYELFKTRFITTASPASYNTTMGIALTINKHLRKEDELLILEFGASQKDDIKNLLKFVSPHYTILTSVGMQHLATFKTKEQIILEKTSLIKAPSSQIAIINNDDQYRSDYNLDANLNVVTVGIDNRADFRARKINYSRNGTTFEIVYGRNVLAVKTQLLGRHNIYNILQAVALIKSVKQFATLPNEQIIHTIARLKPVPHRLAFRVDNGLNILDDSFNSNEIGFNNALEVLRMFPEPRILITPGIVELGPLTTEVNEGLAVNISKACDEVYLIENSSALAIKNGLKKLNYANVHMFKSFHEAFSKAKEKHQTVSILIENDLSDNLIYRG